MASDSRSFSSETLVRGCNLVRCQTMSLESDPQYLAMREQRERLLVSCCKVGTFDHRIVLLVVLLILKLNIFFDLYFKT